MHRKAVRQEVAQLGALGVLVGLGLEDGARRLLGVQEASERVVGERHVANGARGLDGLLARVHEHEHLPGAGALDHLLVRDLVHELVLRHGLLGRDADELLLERHRAVAVVERKEILGLDAQEGRHVLVVGQRGREAHQAHHLLRRLDLAHGARDDRLEHRATLVVQQMYLVEQNQAHELREGTIAALARHNVPLLGRRDDQLRLADLLLREVDVARELAHRQAHLAEHEREVADHLAYETLHRRDVDHLERILVDRHAVLADVLSDGLQHGQQRTDRLARAGRRTHEHVLGRVDGRLVHATLDAIERRDRLAAVLGAPHKDRLRPLGQRAHENALTSLLGRRSLCRNVHLLVALLGHALRARWELEHLVAHKVTTLRECHRLEIEQSSRGTNAAHLTAAALVVAVVVGGSEILGHRVLCQSTCLESNRTLECLGGRELIARALQLVDNTNAHRVRKLGTHLVIDRLALGIRLRLRTTCAVHDLGTVDEKQLDEIKVLKVQQAHELVLAIAVVRARQVAEQSQHLGRQSLCRQRILLKLGDLALQPVGVDLTRIDMECIVIATVLGFHVVVVVALSAAAATGATIAAGTKYHVTGRVDAGGRVVVLGLVVVDLEALLLLVLVILVVEHDSDTAGGIIVTGMGIVVLVVAVVGDATTERRQLRVGLLGRRVEQLAEVHLALGLAQVLVLEHGQHLVGIAAQRARRLVAEALLNDAQQLLVGGTRLARLGLIVGVVDRGRRQHTVALELAQHVRLVLAVGLGTLAELGELLVELLGSTTNNTIAHAARDTASKRPNLRDLIARWCRSFRLQDETRSGAILVLLRASNSF